MSPNLAALLYLVAGALFIMALRGLSSPETSRTGNTYGMVGMAIAVLTTLGIAVPTNPLVWLLIIAGIGIGGAIGAIAAKRIAMTAMPQLVAAFHSLVGLAAVFVAACSASMRRDAFGIADIDAVTNVITGVHPQPHWWRWRIGALRSVRSPSPARSLPSCQAQWATCRGMPIILPFAPLPSTLAMGVAIILLRLGLHRDCQTDVAVLDGDHHQLCPRAGRADDHPDRWR